MSITLASYNIHCCYGRDGRHDPERIRKVLRGLNAQVIALQEVELLHDAPDLLEYFCEDSPWQAVHGLTMARDTGHYGNALLTSLPIQSLQRIDLSEAGREPRGALHAMLEYQGTLLEVMATHLGLRPGERRAQILRLLKVLHAAERPSDDSSLTVLMGDLNEWFMPGRPLRWLQRYFQLSPAPPTFPAGWPMFALDRIWIRPATKLTRVRVVNNALTRLASDHLPLLAHID